MAQTQSLKRRLRSVRNAGQITKALEVVAASRMRKIQELVVKSRSYGELADSIIRRIAPSQEAKQSIFFKDNDSKNKLYIVFNSDRGQAGAFNSNIFNVTRDAVNEDRKLGLSPHLIVFGRKGASHFSRITDITLSGAYVDVPDAPDANFFAPVLESILNGFREEKYSAVDIIFTQFISSLNQKAQKLPLLPIELDPQSETTEGPLKVFEFEPDIETVIDQALQLYLEARIMQAKIESSTSENAMRMVAMGNANRNASDLMDELALELNSLRQAVITQEIAEITGGTEALAA